MKKWTLAILNCFLVTAGLMAQCTVGTISTTDGANTVFTCPGDGQPDEISFISTAANSANQAYAITDLNYTILDITTSNTVDFENTPSGTCLVWGFSYSGNILGTPGESVFTTQFSDGCWLITSNAVRVVRSEVDGGTVNTTDGAGEYFACIGDGFPDFVGFRNNTNSKANYTYVITDKNNVILGLPGQDFVDFEGAGTGTCRVWGLSYTGNVLAMMGDDAANTVLTDGCFDLSDNFITIYRERIESSTISTTNNETFLTIDDVANSSLSFTNSTTGNTDYIYVIANESQEIIAFSDGTYDFSALPRGKYFVWGFSYFGDVLLNPGMSVFATPFSEGCFQVSFNAIVIQKNTDAIAVCTADAGTITADRTPVTQIGGSATLTATPDGNAVVPANYEVVYVLTSGTGLVIEEIGAAPSFTVMGTGRYTIHTLVAELSDNTDPNFLDASIIVPGQTTGVDVLNLISSTGICASLDAAGAPIEVEACTADAGTITADRSPIIQTGGSATLTATPDGNAVVPTDYELVYVLTSGTGLVIEEIGGAPSFTVTGTGRYTIHTLVAELSDNTDPNFLDASIIVPGQTTGVDVLNLINSSGICASLDAAGAPIEVEMCMADAGTITIDQSPVQLSGGNAMVSATPDGNVVIPANYEVVYVLTSGTGLVIEEIGANPSFTVTSTGRYTIHTLVAELSDNTDPNFLDASVIVFGQTTGVDVLNLVASAGICASLDAAGAPVEVVDCLADAGTITADRTPIIQTGGSATLTATPDGNAVVPMDYEVVYVLTSGTGLVIEEIGGAPSFNVSGTGRYTIHTLVAELSDNTDPNFLDASIIVPGQTTGVDVLNLISSTGICASLDAAGAPIEVEMCMADAGTITADRTPVTQTGGSATLTATPDGNAVVPTDYEVVYVLTSGADLVIEQIGASPSFTVMGTGRYTIHTLVAELSDATDPNFLDASVIVFGQTTGVDVLNLVASTGICASLDAAGAPIEVEACTANAGTITADRTPIIQTGGNATLTATPDGNAVVPTDYEVVYVLTSGPDLVIEQIGASPSFMVMETGRYTIHTLVAELSDATDPNFLDASVIVFGQTTGVDVLNLVASTGICASLDAAGAPIEVEACTADAGTITADRTPIIQTGGTATLTATPDGNAVVPTDYEVVYVLTSGPDLVIEEIGASPSFMVMETGRYTIHTLVAELSDNTDPNFLDASVIVFGQTTGVDVLNLVASTGICASLDAAGAPIEVEACTADAGTITIDDNTVELENGMAMLSATPDGNIVVPNEYEVVYVLTSGMDLVIEQIGANPMFTVDDTGRYTIHTLVAELSDDTDPNFLDVSVIVFGQTTGVDVLNLVASTGICASLDAAGAPAFVILPGQCIADAGTITADDNAVELGNDPVMLSATPDGNRFVPTGYEVAYVLTSGVDLVIEQIGATPEFTVQELGRYTIHTLVAELDDPNDPNFLDASIIVFGQTTGVDVLNVIANAGICASLDAAGAPILVIEPGDCVADAGTLTIDEPVVELMSGTATVSATPDGNDFVPTGYEKVFVLTSTANLVIEQIGADPMFTVTDTGRYTIHTLVAELSDPNDPNFLDASVIVFGQTTGVDVLNLVAAAGICADLDAAGAPVQVMPGMFLVDQLPELENTEVGQLERLSVYPNPVSGDQELTVQMEIPSVTSVATLEVINTVGQLVSSQTVTLVKGSNQFMIRMNDLKAGYYVVRVRTATAQWVQPIMRK